MNNAYMACDTRQALAGIEIDNRSLLFDRFAEPELEKDDRKKWFKNAVNIPTDKFRREMWDEFLYKELGMSPSDCLFMKLNARLIINAAVGVMENAGLCLDRFSGVPYIPGSAVKGCARRAAIDELLEADNNNKSEILAKIALVFGWNKSDWSTRRLCENGEKPDFRWACSEDLWPDISAEVRKILLKHFNGRDVLPDAYAGCALFFPAYPVFSPNPDIELDVITCHHQDYYSGKRDIADDTEDPNPVFFPVVAPDHVFCFPVLSDKRMPDNKLLSQAKDWLIKGLTDFGIGAKTNAGYGWFEDVSEDWSNKLKDEFKKAAVTAAKESGLEAQKQAEEQRMAEKRKEKEKLANMTPEQRADHEVMNWNDAQLQGRLSLPDQFLQLEPALQMAVLRLLTGPRVDLWHKIKQDAESKKEKTRKAASKIRDEIYRLAKTANPRIKMP